MESLKNKIPWCILSIFIDDLYALRTTPTRPKPISAALAICAENLYNVLLAISLRHDSSINNIYKRSQNVCKSGWCVWKLAFSNPTKKFCCRSQNKNLGSGRDFVQCKTVIFRHRPFGLTAPERKALLRHGIKTPLFHLKPQCGNLT